ncbi:MAG: hypothetical protein OHK0056_14250 [Bacteriovoracaceae bacterium]
MKRVMILILAFSFSLPALAEEGVAKAILLKGSVTALEGGNPRNIAQGDWVSEGAQIKTEAKSFVKFLFVDKSTMNLGPNSEMKIDTFPKKDAGIVTLIKGQLRSKVTKNYMEIENKDKSKLFIKTKSAAMGVRGTDFQVNYNPENNATALVTFEGRVAMAQLENMDAIRQNVSQQVLEKMVSSPEAVIVTKGQFSGVSEQTSRATIPVKINPAQLETLQKQEIPMTKEDAKEMGLSKEQASIKTFRSVVPPGLSGKSVANDAKAVVNVVAKTAGITVSAAPRPTISAASPPPEGMVDKATGQIAPTAGGFIDVSTAQYIPPPPGSPFDPQTQTYIPPSSVGSVDPITGDFFNKNYKLSSTGQFIPVVQTTDGRAPASTAGTLQASPPPPPTAGFLPTIIDPNTASGYLDSATGKFVSTSRGSLPPSPEGGLIDPTLAEQLAQKTLLRNEQNLTDNLNNPIESTRTRVQFNFNAQ